MQPRRALLVTVLGVLLSGTLTVRTTALGQQVEPAVDAEQNRTIAIGAALDTALDAAAAIRNPLRSTEGMARVADIAWDYDEDGSRKSFERVFDVLVVELRAGGDRGASARPYMEFALELYARHAWERAVDLAILYASSFTPGSADDRYRLATLLARLGIDHSITNPARAADLARRSVQMGVATPELAELLAQLDAPDRYRLVLATVRLARAQQDGLSVLLALNDRLGIVSLDDPVRLGDRSTMELAAEWLQSVRRSLARMANAAAGRAPSGLSLSAPDMDAVIRVLNIQDELLDAFRSWRTENTDRAAELLYSLAVSVSRITDVSLANTIAVRNLRPPTPAELLHLADTAPNEAIADALRQRAALAIAHDRASTRREQYVRSILADIRSGSRRDATTDLAYLVYAEEAIADGRAYEASAYLARVSDAALRCEAAGNCAAAVAGIDADAAGDLANLARIAAASARPNARVVCGLLAATRAVARIDGAARGLELLRDALAAFDRMEYEADARGSASGPDSYFATFGATRVSPYVPVAARDLLLRETMASIVADDEDGIRLAAQGVRSADARLDTFVALALAIEDVRAQPSDTIASE